MATLLSDDAPINAYRDLEVRFKRLGVMNDALSVLHWDAAVMMPPAGAAARAEQLATMRILSHEMLTDPRLADLIDTAKGADLTAWQRANLIEMERKVSKANVVPDRLVSELSVTSSECEHAWRAARESGTFQDVLPLLSKLLDLTKERGEILADLLRRPLYDALMDDFEPGARADDITPIFEDYVAFLPEFLGKVLERQRGIGPKPVPEGPFETAHQRALATQLAEHVGFDFTAGRMDESAHPFSTGYPGDIRITVRYDEQDAATAIMAALHETGHALYEQNLPGEWRHQPVGEARGMAIHESQSLLIEMQACRSAEFISFLGPKLRAALGTQPAFEDQALRRLYHWVEPGYIRVEADEVTYPAHVILRFRLEQALLSGDLPLADLPGAWDDGMEALLGIRPPSEKLGVMQDIHWYDGAFGYFPTYTLGAMTAAQLFRAARDAMPTLGEELARGEFTNLRTWLTAHVHAYGSSLSSAEIVTAATGRSLDPKAFEAHLRERYLPD